METIDVTNLPPDRVAYLKELIETWKKEIQQNGPVTVQTSLSHQDQELIEQIWKLRDEIGPVDFNVVDAIRELREEN